MSEDQDRKVTTEQMENVRKRVALHRARSGSQEATASNFGVSQPLVSKILNSHKTGYRLTYAAVRKMARISGATFEELIHGTASAGRYEAMDELKNRGRALDLLSGVYDEAFLLDAMRITPADSGDWSVERWVEFIVELRKVMRVTGVRHASELRPSAQVFRLPPRRE